ncbi:SIMPL domain-containing protein [Larsenimonas rhizosphaerae]|uniref:SIMPL domain-containing protein n=1 Tax=Larsenimonas rhizosphaerae TaxID=2944682 RepID=A0AA41ZDH1_9GAMM|nr:SIMPL domain-containing protein [Larsenimonas rhizosphaerae]MCX2523307.1 SIMPL domain-containing protein [Larsenimonas rhizosphaerae]
MKNTIIYMPLLALLLLPLPGHAADTPSPAITVSAEANIEAAPDQVKLDAWLVNHTPYTTMDTGNMSSAPFDAARDKVMARATALLDALKKAGIASNDIRAGAVSVNRQTRTEKDDTVQTRWEITRPISITLRQLDHLPQVVNALLDQQVDRLSEPAFDTSQRAALEDKALASAITRARQKAEAIAQASSVHLGPLEQADASTPGAPPMPRYSMMQARSAKESAPALEPGMISIEASVNTRWSIRSAP